MAAKVSENPNASLLPRTMTEQKLISGEEFSFSSHGQKNENEISAVIPSSCSFSKVDENKAKEDSVVLPIKDFSQYRDDFIQTTDESEDTEGPYAKAKTKRNAASNQSRHGSRCSPPTLKADKGQTSKNRAQQVSGTQEDSSVKPCVIDDRQKNFADDVTDGVATFQVSSSEGTTVEQDHNKEQERKLHTSNRETRGNGTVVKIERSPKQDGVKGTGISKNGKERRSLANSRENDANTSFCQGGDVVADNGDANHADEVLGACGYQNSCYPQGAEGKDANARGSKKKRKEPLGLKGGRRDEFSSNHSSLYIPCTSESSHLGIKSGFLARHSNDNSMSCSMDETEGRLHCASFCQFPDCAECSSRDTASASITALTSPAQSFLNFNSYRPEQSFSLPYNSKYRSPKNEEILSLPPPPPPQFPGLPYDVPQERHHVSENCFDIGDVQSRTWRPIDSDASLFAQTSSNSSTWFAGFTNPENSTGSGGQNTGINQREISRSAFSVHATSTTPNFISEQAETSLASERAMRQQERERIKRETVTARVSTDDESTTMQPSLANSNSGTTSDDNSLAALERRVAEACSLVERVMKEREEKEKAIKERERRQREVRARREQHEQERRERDARETMQKNETGGTSTGSEEEAPSERAALPESPQWLCEHYQRLCRVKFPCCGKFYPCHRCHNNSDECENHNCKAKEAFYIECSVCRHQQVVCKTLSYFIVIF